MRVGVLGAGFAGLAAAYDLAGAGHEVVVFEPMDQPGGLAAGFRDPRWAWPLERFYHHLFTSDDAILGLAAETGFADRVLVRRPVTASFFRGRAYALDGPLPVLAFPGMPPVDRLRMGLAIAYLKVTRDWRALEDVTARDWVLRWMGRPAYTAVWEPLLIGKFGPRHADVPMSWLWARLHKRSMRLVYFEGGFQAFADHLAAAVADRGADLRLEARVTRVARDGEGLVVDVAGGPPARFDRVIATVGPHLLARLAPELPADYLAGLAALPYLGAIVAVLALERQLMPEVYWLSMDKREFPFLACVEHTNFVGPEHYGGDHLVYLGDYLPPDDPAFGLTDEGLLDAWLPSLARINPAFDRAWIRRAWVHRAGYAQPVVPLGFSAHIPPLATPVAGLYLASMSQVYPWDRGTNYAVEIGRRAAAEVVGGAAGLGGGRPAE